MGFVSQKAVRKPSLGTPCFQPDFTALPCSCSSPRAPAATCRPPPGPGANWSQYHTAALTGALAMEGSSPSSPSASRPCRLDGESERCQTPHLLFLFLLPHPFHGLTPKSSCLLPDPCQLLFAACLTLLCSCPTTLLSQTPRCTSGRALPSRTKSKLPTKRAASPDSGSGDRTWAWGR